MKKTQKHSRHLFTPEEDEMLREAVKSDGCSKWEKIAHKIPNKTARQCRDRWVNYLAPGNIKKEWTSEEDELLIQKIHELGTHWSQISKFFEGRSEAHVKNRWYSKLKSRYANNIALSNATSNQDFWDKHLLHSSEISDTIEIQDQAIEVLTDCFSTL